MCFFLDCCTSPVLEPSGTHRARLFGVRGDVALTKKPLFLETAYSLLRAGIKL